MRVFPACLLGLLLTNRMGAAAAQEPPPPATLPPVPGQAGQTTPPPLPPAPEQPPTTAEERAAREALEQARLRNRKPEDLPLDRLRPRAGDPAATAQGQRDAVPPEERDRLIVENADEVRGDEASQMLVATGNIRARYNGYRATCDRATANRRTNVVTFESNVTLYTTRQTIYADYVQINTKTNEFVTRGGRTIVPPDLIGQQIVQPLFLSGQSLKREGNIYEAEYGLLTTCDFPNPHYKIGFRKLNLIPNDRIVIRDAVIYRYDRVVARVPYLVFPIREEVRYSYLPYIGRTNEEGWFLKVILGYSLSRTLPGLLRVDVMEKKGVGYGFDQAYRFGDRSAGTFVLYNLNDRSRAVNDFHGRLNHQQLIGDINATISHDFQNNSYQSLTANSRTSQSNITLGRTAGGRTTGITYSQGLTDYGASKGTTTTFSLTETERFRPFGPGGTLTFRFNSNDNTSRSTFGTTTSISGRQEQTGDLKATGKVGIFDIDVAANRNFLLRQKGTAGGVAFSGTQRLPDLKMTTSTDRLGKTLARVPARLSFGFGRFLETIATPTATGPLTGRDVTTSRLLFEVTPESKRIPLTPGGRLSLNLDGNFQQTVYRDDAAQYILTGRGSLTQQLGENSTWNFNYNYLRPYGGTPADFRLDRTGSTNNIGTNLQVNTYRTKLSLITGYDIERANADLGAGIPRNPWQNLTAQLGLRPSHIFQTRFTATYDINGGRLLDATNRMRFRGRGDFGLDIGLRYDPRTKKFPQITEALTTPLFSRDVTLTALAGYNGQIKRFDYKQFAIVQRFHDYDLVYSYIDQPYGFRSERGFNFTIRLRAFPAGRPQSTGQFGTPIDTGGGEIF